MAVPLGILSNLSKFCWNKRCPSLPDKVCFLTVFPLSENHPVLCVQNFCTEGKQKPVQKGEKEKPKRQWSKEELIEIAKYKSITTKLYGPQLNPTQPSEQSKGRKKSTDNFYLTVAEQKEFNYIFRSLYGRKTRTNPKAYQNARKQNDIHKHIEGELNEFVDTDISFILTEWSQESKAHPVEDCFLNVNQKNESTSLKKIDAVNSPKNDSLYTEEGTTKKQIEKISNKTQNELSEDSSDTKGPSNIYISPLPEFVSNLHDSIKSSSVINDKLKYIKSCKILPVNSGSNEEEVIFHQFVENLNLRNLPSVTKVLDVTMSAKARFYLDRWKLQMIEEMGEEGFKKMQQETFRTGSSFHTNVQQFLSGQEVSTIDPENEGLWKSIQHVFQDIGETKAVEVFVKHKSLFYQGKFDCIGIFRNTLCLIDWKTSKKPKPLLSNTYDNPLQIVAYMGAINNSLDAHDLGTELITHGALVIAYKDGHPADVHLMDLKTCEKYWEDWIDRLHSYWKVQASDQSESAETRTE